jgi:hypothetical protein
MKVALVLLFGLFFFNTSIGQQIDMELNLLGYSFTQNGEQLNWKQLVAATESNFEANELIKIARSHTVSTITSAVGGVLIGIPIGQSLSDQDPNWTLAYIGGGITLISFPFTFSAFNKVNKGVDDYNLSLQSTSSFRNKAEFDFIVNSNGVGLSMRF